MQFVTFLLSLAQPYWGQLVVGAASVAALLFAYLKGREAAKAKGIIATQQETIDAQKARNDVQARVDNASPTERDKLLAPFLRDDK